MEEHTCNRCGNTITLPDEESTARLNEDGTWDCSHCVRIDKLAAQFVQVRNFGAVNMFDRQGVAAIADSMGLYELVDIATDRRDYGQLLEELNGHPLLTT